MELKIKSKTSGFASPAEAYVDKRLDFNELISPNTHSTFSFRYEGEPVFGLRHGNIVVIDRSIHPKVGELILTTINKQFKIVRYDGISEFWGRVSWILKKQI